MADTTPSGNDALARLGQFLQGLTLNQRLLLAGGTLLVAATLWGFVVLLGQPKYVTLYSGLRSDEAQTLASRLAAKNIPHQISPDGSSVLVPDDKLDASRLETAAAGLPRSARLGFELFDTPNWAGSDFTEKVNYQRALEGELERTLATLSEVEAVRVHLVMPQESLFTEEQHDAKAAVIIKTRGGRLSEEAQHAIPQLVASAVDRLRPENVTVVDADSNTPLLHNRDGASGRAYGLDEELAKTLVHTLEPVVGPDHVRASVHLEYELGTRRRQFRNLRSQEPSNAHARTLGGELDRRRSGGYSGHGQQRAREYSTDDSSTGPGRARQYEHGHELFSKLLPKLFRGFHCGR
jgi:flagellar M-ring protein FliF